MMSTCLIRGINRLLSLNHNLASASLALSNDSISLSLSIVCNIGWWLHAGIIFLGSELSKLTRCEWLNFCAFIKPIWYNSTIMTKEQSSFGPSAVAVIENKVAKTSCIFFSKPTQCQKHIRCQPWILQCLDLFVHCERRHGSTNSHWCRIHHRRNTLRTTCPFSRSVVKLVPLSLPSWILNCSSKVLKRQSAPESLKF